MTEKETPAHKFFKIAAHGDWLYALEERTGAVWEFGIHERMSFRRNWIKLPALPGNRASTDLTFSGNNPEDHFPTTADVYVLANDGSIWLLRDLVSEVLWERVS